MIRRSILPSLTFAVLWFAAALSGIDDVVAQTTDREKILNSDDWKKTMQDLEEWSSVQQIYDQDQLAQKKRELDRKIAGMSAEQLTDFLAELKQKLVILNSAEARSARRWMDETMAVAAPAYVQKIRAGLPDISGMTAAQLQQQLDLFQDRIDTTRKSAADAAKFREDQVKQIRQQRIRDDSARLQSELAAESAPRSNYNFTIQQRRTYSAPAFQRRYGVYPLLYGGYRW